MKGLSIVFVGANSGTSRHRALAFQRLGHRVCVVDPRTLLPSARLISKWIWETGALFLESLIAKRVMAAIPAGPFDLAYVDGGELVGPKLAEELKSRCGTVINYNVDDPFGQRDGHRWRAYLRATPFYDLLVVVRECNVAEARAAGAKKVLYVYRSADELAHAPREITDTEGRRWESEVVFIGTWMPERGPLLSKLVQLGVPISIFGNQWSRASEWATLKPYWRGPGLDNDDSYARAVQRAKVCLGLLSKENRDLSTTRSFEIPHLGGVFCGERTPEHVKLYRENEEAVFWSTPEECAEKCRYLLANENERRRIALNGRRRCLDNKTTNEKVLAQILEAAFA